MCVCVAWWGGGGGGKGARGPRGEEGACRAF